MAIQEAIWYTNIEYQPPIVIPAGASRGIDINLKEGGYNTISVQPKVIFGSSPDGNCVVSFYASTDEGATIDTEPFISIPITEATSETKSLSVSVKDFAYVRVIATNNDGTDDVTYSGKYAGVKYTI